MAKRNYDEKFKRDAVELLLSGAKELKPLARDLGVCPVTLRRWRDRYLREREPSQDLPREATSRELAEEIRRLRKENETLKRQQEILEKALDIVSEQSPEDMP